ncbi:MAG: hypothetical protein ACPL89_04390 [Roseiflexus castenholzii]
MPQQHGQLSMPPGYATMRRNLIRRRPVGIRAANTVLRAIAAGQEFTEQRGAETVILADLLRRAGAFAEARTINARRRPGITDSTILRLLAFQDSLIARGDVARHTLDEAMGEDE